MRRQFLSCLRLCFLCVAFTQGVGILCAIRGASPSPPDTGSASDGFLNADMEQLSLAVMSGALEQKTGKSPPSAFTPTPLQFSTARVPNTANDARHLLQSGESRRRNEAGFSCYLPIEDRQRYTSTDDGTWLIDDAVLEEVDNDLQAIVNCTKKSDEIAFNVTKVIQPSSVVIIPWQLTLDTYDDGSGSTVSLRSKTRTRFTCPRKNSGLFLVWAATSVTFADLIFEGCTFDGTDEAQSAVIDVSRCHDRDAPGLVSLRGVTFRRNNLTAASGLRMSASSCSDLEMVDVKIADNECSSDGCGVLLGKRSNLENCTVSRNRLVESDEQMSSMLYAPLASNTTIQGFAASRNDVAVIRVRNGVLSLSKASFNRNPLRRHTGKTKVSCIHLVRSSAKIIRCNFTENNVYERSVVLFKKSNVSMSSSIFRNNVVFWTGRCVLALKANMKLENTAAISNSALNNIGGGFLHTRDSIVTLENTHATGNSAGSSGGFMDAYDSEVTLKHTHATGNSAGSSGGFLNAHDSEVTLENTSATNSSARFGGGFLMASKSNVKTENTTTTNSRAESYGGSVYLQSSKLRIVHSRFSWSKSNISGGFVALEGSSIQINDSELFQGRSKNGGAIWMRESNMTAHTLSIIHCRADHHGGAVMSFAYSAFRCAGCKFKNNSADNGNGGAVFFDSRPNQTLALQLVQSRFENNEAELGGGLFFVSGGNDERCVANGTACPFMALTDTKFSGNKAEVAGGGIFAGYLAAIRFNCSKVSLDTNSEFNEEAKWEALKRLESEADICPSWKGNHANLYGPEVGTYAYSATMTIEEAKTSVCLSGGGDCVIDGYRAGSDLPKAKVQLLDGLRQGPARNYRTVNAMMSSVDGEFMVGSVVLPMEEGSCTFQSIRGFVAPGKYQLTVELDIEMIENIWIAVFVRECSIGETAALATGVCQECTITTYNFDTSAKECQQCPENGNCESKVITPNDGYWQKTPCSDRLHRCLPTSACKFEGRSEGLKNLTDDIRSCEMDDERRTEYTQAQCAKGHEGPLCGSCSRGYGSGSSARCRKCSKGFVNVALILTSVLFLIVLTGITVNGTLNVQKTDPRELRRQNAFTRSIELRSLRYLEGQSERANTDEFSHRGDSPNVESVEGVPADEALLAKWKAVEMFKISLSFVQTTILLATLDVGWSLPLLILAEAAEYISGLASDGNRRSVTCLASEDPFMHPAALAFAFNTCFVPIFVFFLWLGFWMVKMAGGKDRALRFLVKRCMLSLMAMWYITLVPVLKTTLSIGLCVDVDDSLDVYTADLTTRYWAVDTKVKCHEGDHAKVLYLVVLPFLCPMYGGFLVVFFLILGSRVERLCDKNSWIYETTGFLYRSYSLGRRRYWEVAIVLRKVAIAFMVFCAHLYDSVVPMTGVSLVMTLAIVAQIVVKPYRKEFEDLNKFELASMFVSLVTTHIGTMLRQEDFPENVTRELSTAACVLANLVTFVTFAYCNLKFLAEYLRHKLIEQNEECEPDWGVFKVLVRFIGCKVKHAIDGLKKRFASSDASDDASTRC